MDLQRPAARETEISLSKSRPSLKKTNAIADLRHGLVGSRQLIQDILNLREETRLFTGHVYMPGGRQALWESAMAEQKEKKPHVAGKSRSYFIRLREARDKTLSMPKLILHALQVNIHGGELPQAEDGRRYLKIPLEVLAESI